MLLDATRTAACLPWGALVSEIEALLADPAVHVPARIVQPLAGGGSLFVMPGADARTAMTKLITFTPANVGTARASIQGDVAVFDVATGARVAVLDGPTVTARRTAAVSALAARRLAPSASGPMLIVGAGVQGRAHLDAFAAVLGVREFRIASRRIESAEALAGAARAAGMGAEAVADADAAAHGCAFIATCTPADGVVLRTPLAAGAFVAAVGAFTPSMIELGAELCRDAAAHGRIVVDTREADHEAGDLIQAGIDVAALPTLAAALGDAAPARARGPVLFKSCGWAGWDLAAARLAARLAS